MNVNKKMSSEDFFSEVIDIYQNAREQKYANLNIFRGRSVSSSSEIEDLTARFLASNISKKYLYFVDQPMKFEGFPTKYPDIAIQDCKNGLIRNLIDVKNDLGFKKRTGIFDFCEKWDAVIESIKGTKTQFKLGHNKKLCEGMFSEDLKYHVVIVTEKNSGKKLKEDRKRVDELKNVKLYVLSKGVHPNKYLEKSEIINKLVIQQEEFEQLIDFIKGNDLSVTIPEPNCLLK
jgi:hypothetical protein